MIENVEKLMRQWVESLNDAYVLSLYDALPAGKRLRAKLVLLIAKEHKDAVTLAAVIELIHAASLLHDDVIDEATLRRGVASVNATEGSKTAVMVGDILYSKAYMELAQLGSEIAREVASAVTQLSLGELIDVELSKNFNSDAEIYLDMIYKKTASLIEATAKCAAMLVDKPFEAYALYGKNLGLAFQIIDDILDITSDEATLGKPVLNDYVEGKCTLPYIYLYGKCSDPQRLKAAHTKPLEADEKSWIISEMHRHKSIDESYLLAQKLSDEASKIVVDEPELKMVLETMMKRNF